MRLAALGLALALLTGCAAQPRDVAVESINAASDFASVAEHTLAELDRQEEQAALAASTNADDAKPKVAAVRARFEAAWVAYRDFRAAWLAAAAGAQAYDAGVAAKRQPDVANLLKLAGSLADAETAFMQATAQIRSGK